MFITIPFTPEGGGGLLMKKTALILLATLLLLSATAISKTEQTNGKPFQEIWDYLYGLQGQIDSFFDVFVTQEEYEDKITELETRISALESCVPCNEGCEDNTDCASTEFCAKDDCDAVGTCTAKPELCVMLWNPVCGCDGQTYDNTCIAHAAGVNVNHEGECQGTSGCLVDSDCNDDIGCTSDICLPSGECNNVPSNELCWDSNECTDDLCELEVGCSNPPTAPGMPCDDGNECTLQDTCDGTGLCTGEVNPICLQCVEGEIEYCEITNEYGTCGGMETCIGGELVGCTAMTPDFEVCDGLDNDCDGTIDEDWPDLETPCTVGLGECVDTGFYTCTMDMIGLECNAVAGTPSPEVCDDLDNDCDGSTDEGLGGEACDGGDIDLCMEGFTMCSAGQMICDESELENYDVCDGSDNDCNPATADGSQDPLLATQCDTGLYGICAPGEMQCSSGAMSCVQYQQPSAEMCNGLDDDCDGVTDEGC